MGRKWDVHKICTSRSHEFIKTLPKGLNGRAEGNFLIIKVPQYPHKLHDAFMDWCISNTITDGFSL